MNEYLSKLWQWLLAFVFNPKTFTLAATILTLYAQFLRGEIPTTEALWVAVQAAIIAWLGASLVHGGAKRVGLMH